MYLWIYKLHLLNVHNCLGKQLTKLRILNMYEEQEKSQITYSHCLIIKTFQKPLMNPSTVHLN